MPDGRVEMLKVEVLSKVIINRPVISSISTVAIWSRRPSIWTMPFVGLGYNEMEEGLSTSPIPTSGQTVMASLQALCATWLPSHRARTRNRWHPSSERVIANVVSEVSTMVALSQLPVSGI